MTCAIERFKKIANSLLVQSLAHLNLWNWLAKIEMPCRFIIRKSKIQTGDIAPTVSHKVKCRQEIWLKVVFLK